MPVGTVSSAKPTVVFRLSTKSWELRTSLYWSKPT